ncbi:MAG: (Fe-S)-binding protein [Candidatus Methanolliviera hydrocarbonicum]|uniref:(Fe-S)-binding protein n=1 Tax=Candidatus Methanolliviera hydrocarbonicum TaxID=2491085 RepID=A0A520KUQ2_9EURY|nr:MAG: (Fe-S)-binding protein [Candidatus Methanolliviera hydrocarbonicum]
MNEAKFDIFEPFDKDSCTLCGECFNKCPVMHLPLDKAKEEIERLIDGDETEYVLQRCTSCFACNFICPEHCNPTQLILDRWHENYLEEGLPLRALHYIPHNRPNFRTYVLERLPEDEKEILRSWNDLSPCEEIFYPGCNVITSPYLTKTKLLDGLEIRGSLDTCCGEMYYRMGLFEQVEQVAKRLKNYFERLDVKKMIIPCTAGRNMFINVLPKFGVKFNFEIQHLLPWLWERMEDGRIEIKKTVDITVTIQESCYGKMFGKNYLDLIRKILERIGVKVVEMEHCRECSLCCGIAGGFSPESAYSPTNLMLATIRSLKEAKRTKADAIVTYCAGCLQELSTVQTLYSTGMPIYHIIELLQMAIGEKPLRRNRERGRQLLLGVFRNQFPKLVSDERFYAEKIEKDFM